MNPSAERNPFRMKSISRFSALFFFALILLMGCEKDGGMLGLDLLDEEKAGVGVLLKFPVVAYTVEDDSILTRNPNAGLAGSYQDPETGFHSAYFVTQLLLQSAQPNFGQNPVLDSARLILRYQGSYGDTNRPMSFKVFRLDEYLDPDFESGYYSSRNWAVGDLIGQENYSEFRPRKSFVEDGDTLSPRLIIPLDASYLQQVIIDGSTTSPTDFANNDAFVQYFNGIAVQSGGEDAAIFQFDISSGISRIQLFYHNDSDTGVFDLRTDQSTEGANHFEHDYSAAAFDPLNPDTVNGSDFVYVQAMGGCIAALEFPTLAGIIDSNYLINKAELNLTIEIGSDARFDVPVFMLILEENDSGKVLIKDYIGLSLQAEQVKKDDYRQKKYSFNITRHIFETLYERNGKTKLYLVSASGASTSNRVVLNGNAHPGNPLTLDLYVSQSP
jgi:hypothetical protein